ncbi:MAG: DUF4416 family protein [Phycisphaerales bacterium]|nr:DUF4416 family protein [Phycisphaerales bacterium]
MGAIRPPKRAKLLVGLLAGDTDLFVHARRRLEFHFGEVDFESAIWPFTNTDYYEVELGPAVYRQFLFFAEPISVERLAEIKRLTNDIERQIAEEHGRPATMRPVNIDPGYITLSKLVLASTKDHAHRIYLQAGIYAEVTLRFQEGDWRALPWTYPDYAAVTYHTAFRDARERLKEQIGRLDG